MSDEARKELQDSLKAITKRSAERKAQIDKEAKKNAEKAKECWNIVYTLSPDDKQAKAFLGIK